MWNDDLLKAPRSVICAGGNHRATTKYLSGSAIEPVFFVKSSSSVVPGGTEIRIPAGHSTVHVSGELAVVIASPTCRVSPETARNHILGYTCANDVTLGALLAEESQWFRAKSADTFCPLGPVVVSTMPPEHATISTTINGSIVSTGRLSELRWTPDELISAISMYMTLERGDVVLTGSPTGLAEATSGDRVSISISEIGALTNNVQ